MSWSGPVAGAAYQPPSYGNGPPQPYQHRQQPGYVPKKKPIITRYAPPPGYRGPVQPQAPFGMSQYPNQYQQPQQHYPQGPPVPPAYPNQGCQAPQSYPPQNYGSPQAYPQQQPYPASTYPPPSNYQWPQPTQPPHPLQSGFPQPSGYPGGPIQPPSQSAYQNYPAQSASVDPNQAAWAQAHTWQQPNGAPSYPPGTQHNSIGGSPPSTSPTSEPITTSTSAHPPASHSAPEAAQACVPVGEGSTGEKLQLSLAWDDWDFDFEGAIWPKANEPVDPNLSLGAIIWRPAKQATRALPSTFERAEEQALMPPAEKLGNGESVSIYFAPGNSHEAFLDIRQTSAWYKIRKDPIFVVFTDEELTQNLVPLEQCLAIRDRPDQPLEETTADEGEDGDEDMHDASRSPGTLPWSSPDLPRRFGSVMDTLEQALSSDTEAIRSSLPKASGIPSRDQRQEEILAKLGVTGSARDQNQEDILAKLGVTGSPKPPSNEPVLVDFSPNDKLPASLPEKPPAPPPSSIPPRPDHPPQRAHSYGGHRNSTYGPPPQRPYGSLSSALHSQHPPSKRQQPEFSKYHHTQSLPQGHSPNGSQNSPTRFESSRRTLPGADFGSEKPTSNDKDTTHVPQLKRSDSSFARKRNFEDTEQEDEKLRQQDDHTKRKRRSQVAAAYR